MAYVCKKMTEDDDDFPNKVRSIFKEVNIRGTDIDVFKTIALEAGEKSGTAQERL